MTSSQTQASAADAVGRHEPVLLERCLDLLAPAIEGAADSASTAGPAQPVMIDCTLGMGGHTEAALERFPSLRVVGIDRDPEAIALASARLARFGDRFIAVQTTYDAVSRVAREHSARAEGTVDAVLMDLGVSSLQLDEASRGFSYARPAPLDMRMDQGSGSWPSSSVSPCPQRLAEAAGTRPNGPSRRCASPSTPSSTSWSGPCPGLSTACAWEDASWWSPTSPWRTASSSGRWPTEPPPGRPRTCRSSPRRTVPTWS